MPKKISLLLFTIKSLFEPTLSLPKVLLSLSGNEKAGIILVDRQKDIWSWSMI